VGGTDIDKAFGVDVDSIGAVATTGVFGANVDFGGGSTDNSSGMGDYFLIKYLP